MPPTASSPPAAPPGRKPAWELALLFPDQGNWTEEGYLHFNRGEKGIELVNGSIEILPMPTQKDQDIILFLLDALRAFVLPGKLGKVLFAGLRVRLEQDHIREPDIVFMLASNSARRSDAFWEGADLVMEVVSADDEKRDYVAKRRDYALAGIAEYWIVDPKKKLIMVLTLDGSSYREHGIYSATQQAASVLLPGFTVDVFACLAAGE